MIKFYSTGCPKCTVLKAKMDMMHVDYETISNEEEIRSVANTFGIDTLPFIVNGDEVYDFGKAIAFLRQCETTPDFVCESCHID